MIAPFPGTMKEFQNRIEVDKILEECWKNPDAGYEVQPSDEWIVNNQQQQRVDGGYFDILESDNFGESTTMAAPKRPSTYGEITSLGARQLFGAMGLLDYPRNQQHLRRWQQQRQQRQPERPVHFFDLGSGTGKLVGQAVLELPPGAIERATGIELSPSRHESAVQAKEALRRLLEAGCRSECTEIDRDERFNNEIRIFQSRETIHRSRSDNLELLQGDLFDVDLSTATHIYVASLCFPDNLMARLEKKLQMLLQQQLERQQEQPHDVAGESELQWVASLQPFPNNLGGIRPIVRFMEMSWTKPFGSAVYIYRCSAGSPKNRKEKD